MSFPPYTADDELIAKAEAERHFRRVTQASELKMQSRLDQLRWELVQTVQSRLQERMRALCADRDDYRSWLIETLREAAALLPDGELRAEVKKVVPLNMGALALSALGLLVLYSAAGGDDQLVVRQCVRLGIAFGAMFFIAQLRPQWLFRWTPWIYGFGLLLLIGNIISDVLVALEGVDLYTFHYPADIMAALQADQEA